MARKRAHKENRWWQLATVFGIQTKRYTAVKYKSNRTILMLYICCVLQIYLLWTNCVISPVVAAVQKTEMQYYKNSGNNNFHDLIEHYHYQVNKSNIHQNTTNLSLKNRAKMNIVTANQTIGNFSSNNHSVKVKNTRHPKTFPQIVNYTKFIDRKKFTKKSRLQHSKYSSPKIALPTIYRTLGKDGKENKFPLKQITKKNVIHNLLFRKIKRNVNNNSSNHLLFKSNFSHHESHIDDDGSNSRKSSGIVTTLSPTQTATKSITKPAEPILLSLNNNSLQNFHHTSAVTNASEANTTASSSLLNTTSEINRNETSSNKNNSNNNNNGIIKSITTSIATTTTRQPRNNYQQSSSYKVNNVFEMARKLRYNKLLTKDLSGPNANNSSESSMYRNSNRKGIVSVLGLFELTTRYGIRPEGRSELAAAQMAVRHINERGLLPGYTLQLLTNDTKVSVYILL